MAFLRRRSSLRFQELPSSPSPNYPILNSNIIIITNNINNSKSLSTFTKRTITNFRIRPLTYLKRGNNNGNRFLTNHSINNIINNNHTCHILPDL